MGGRIDEATERDLINIKCHFNAHTRSSHKTDVFSLFCAIGPGGPRMVLV